MNHKRMHSKYEEAAKRRILATLAAIGYTVQRVTRNGHTLNIIVPVSS